MSHDNGFEEWGGYMGAKITKLEEQFSAASDPFRKTNLFAGISIYVNGRTDPTADELKRIMMVHGGTYHHYERSHTTYIIASNLPDVKVRNMNTSKIISPQWVVDCVQEQRILDYARYLLYTNQKTSQPRLTFIKQPKPEEAPSTAEQTAEQVANILQGLDDLNAKIKESLANPASAIAEFGLKQSISAGKATDHVDLRTTATITTVAAVNATGTTANTTASGGGGGVGGRVARTAVDPNFLSEFYNNSRLHHIATLSASFKQLVAELREQQSDCLGFPARQQLKQKLQMQAVPNCVRNAGPVIMHIDMDCFFVSVGLRKHPELRGRPVAVTHSKGGTAATEVPVQPGADRQLEMELFAKRFEHSNVLSDKVRHGFDAKLSLSEIASCSYEARAKGIRNGMFVGKAMKLCPELQTIPYDFEGYKEVAYALYEIIAQYTLNIEAVSCDEVFVDLGDVLSELQVTPMDFVSALREEVRQKTGCACSAGVGANKLQARMATKRAKPDGQYHLVTTDVEAYMAAIPIEELPGVGCNIAFNLKEANLYSCGDLQRVSLSRIQMLFGKKFGEKLHKFCRGIDNKPMSYGQVRKSVSAEVNYGIRFKEYAEVENFLRLLSLELHSRLIDIKRKTKCVTLKVMVRAKDAPVETSKFMGHGVCDHITKSVSLIEFTNDLAILTRTVLTAMKALNLPPHELRGVGIQLSKLDEPHKAKEQKKDCVLKHMFERAAVKQKERNAEDVVKVQLPVKVSGTENLATNNKADKNMRGRPAKEKKKEVSKRPADVMNMFQNVAAKRVAKMEKNNEQCADGGRKTSSNVFGARTFDCADFLPAEIDLDVFNALPEDIRAEVFTDCMQKNAEAATTLLSIGTTTATAKPDGNCVDSSLIESDLLPSTSRAALEKRLRDDATKAPPKQSATVAMGGMTIPVDKEYMAALPAELRAEIEAELATERQRLPEAALQYASYDPVTPPLAAEATAVGTEAAEPAPQNVISIDNVFAQKNSSEILLTWVLNSTEPLGEDVQHLSEDACEMVRAKAIDTLYDPLFYLCRLLNSQKDGSNNCVWHRAYKSILTAVQLEMHMVYNGRKLYSGEMLLCNECESEY